MTMRRIRLSIEAENDIAAILDWSHDQFGELARLRYEALLAQAILDLAKAPERPGVSDRPELANGARTFHLTHSRDHVDPKIGRVRNPRHFLLFRLSPDGCLEIGRVLHDSMDLIRHLPEDYQAEEPKSEP